MASLLPFLSIYLTPLLPCLDPGLAPILKLPPSYYLARQGQASPNVLKGEDLEQSDALRTVFARSTRHPKQASCDLAHTTR